MAPEASTLAEPKRLVAEFLTILVGVLAALAVDAWYGGVVDRRLGAEYEQRIADELHEVRTLLGDLQGRLEGNLAAASVAAGFFEADPASVDPDQALAALYLVGIGLPRRFDVSTFEDLLSTGRLGLITDVERRESVQRAYRAIEEAQILVAPYRDEYIRAIQARFPLDLIDQIRAECLSPNPADWGCPSLDLDDQVVRDIVRGLSTDDALVGFRLRQYGLRTQTAMLRDAADAVDDALAVLPEASGGAT